MPSYSPTSPTRPYRQHSTASRTVLSPSKLVPSNPWHHRPQQQQGGAAPLRSTGCRSLSPRSASRSVSPPPAVVSLTAADTITAAPDEAAALQPCHTALLLLGGLLNSIKSRRSRKADLDSVTQDLLLITTLLANAQRGLGAATDGQHREQVEALRDDLVLALRQLEPALAFSKTAAEAPTKLLACVLQLHDLHLSASKLLWQCGLSAQSITGCVDSCFTTMFLGTASKADHEAAGEAEVSDHAWQVPKERVDALVLSVTLADSQHFHEALWELTRTAMTNRLWEAADILLAVPIVLHHLSTTHSDTTAVSSDSSAPSDSISTSSTHSGAPAGQDSASSPPLMVYLRGGSSASGSPSAAEYASHVADTLTRTLPSPAAQQLWRRIHWDAFDVLGWKLRLETWVHGTGEPVPPITWSGQGVTETVIGAAGGPQSVPRAFRRASRTPRRARRGSPGAASQLPEDILRVASVPALTEAYNVLHSANRPIGTGIIHAAQQLLLTTAVYNAVCRDSCRWEDSYVCSHAWLDAVTRIALSPSQAPKPKRGRGRPRKRSPSPSPSPESDLPRFAGSTELLLSLLAAAQQLRGSWQLPQPALTTLDTALVGSWHNAVTTWHAPGAHTQQKDTSSSTGTQKGASDAWLKLVWGWAPRDTQPDQHLGHALIFSTHGSHTGSATQHTGFPDLTQAVGLFTDICSLRSGPPSQLLTDLVLYSAMQAADAAAADAADALGVTCRLSREGAGTHAAGSDEDTPCPVADDAELMQRAVSILSALQALIQLHLDWQQQQQGGMAAQGVGSVLQSDGDRTAGVEARQVAEQLLTKLLVLVALLPTCAWSSLSFLTQTYPALAQVVCGRMRHRPEELLMDRYLDSTIQIMRDSSASSSHSTLTADQLLNLLTAATLVPTCMLPAGWSQAVDAALLSVIRAAGVTRFMRPEVWAPLLRTAAAQGWACPYAAAELLALAADQPDMFTGELTLYDVDDLLVGGLWPELQARLVHVAPGRRVQKGRDSSTGVPVTDDHLRMFTMLHANAVQQKQRQEQDVFSFV